MNNVAPSPKKMTLSPPVEKLIGVYKDQYLRELQTPEIAIIHVDELASKIALYYEKIRKVVDWKEEHLVRRGAIERILKRALMSEIAGLAFVPNPNFEEAAESLVIELIRGGHFANDKIPSAKIQVVQRILEKYTLLLENNPLAKEIKNSVRIKKKINIFNWLLELAACEIEEAIDPPVTQYALIECMLTSMLERVTIKPKESLSANETWLQLFIAIQRALLHLDDPIISFRLSRVYYANWHQMNETELTEIARTIFQLEERINADLNLPAGAKFYQICEKYDTIYLMLDDVLKMYKNRPRRIESVFTDKKILFAKIKKSYSRRPKTLKKRLYRSAIFSTLSIFVAGAFSLFVIEGPIAKFFYGEFKPLAIAVDILLPTAMMYFLVSIIKPPRPENLKRVLQETKKVVFLQKEKDVYELRLLKKKRPILNFFVGLLYTLGSALSLWLVFQLFNIAKIPPTSLYIDTLNVAMIVFAAMVIKQRSKELTIDEKVTFWEFTLDIVSVPLGRLGQWLSNKWKEYNIVSVFMIALVDMPFSKFLSFVSSWSSYLKEKKSEIH